MHHDPMEINFRPGGRQVKINCKIHRKIDRGPGSGPRTTGGPPC
jgi:hypothetical protein